MAPALIVVAIGADPPAPSSSARSCCRSASRSRWCRCSWSAAIATSWGRSSISAHDDRGDRWSRRDHLPERLPARADAPRLTPAAADLPLAPTWRGRRHLARRRHLAPSPPLGAVAATWRRATWHPARAVGRGAYALLASTSTSSSRAASRAWSSARRSSWRSSAATTIGQNCVPAWRRSSARAALTVRAPAVRTGGGHGVEGVGDARDAGLDADLGRRRGDPGSRCRPGSRGGGG